MGTLSAASGLKSFAVATSCGFCLASYQDGGWTKDPEMRPLADSPLGKIVTLVLTRLLVSTPELASQLIGSGVKVAMDNYFTSLLLFLYLLKSKIFAVGTARTNRKGFAGALDVFRKKTTRLRKRSDMNFARSGEIAVCEWKDTKVVTFASTIHIKESDFQPKEYR